MDAQGNVWPAAGTITRFAPPSGPGIRVDHALAAGYAPSTVFDSLLAKLIIHAPTREILFRRATRALRDFGIDGLATNILFLTRLVGMDAVLADDIHTGFIEAHAAELGETAPETLPFGDTVPDGVIAITAPMTGQLVSLAVAEGDEIRAGQTAGLVEAMKMQVALTPAQPGRVRALLAAPGTKVREGQTILLIEPISLAGGAAAEATHDPDAIRPDLAEFLQRQGTTKDAARPAAIAKRLAQGKRSIRENLACLLDPGTFIEYGALAVAAQRNRRSLEDLISLTPADGLISGIGKVDSHDIAILAYDYTVLAGTQGFIGHKKTDRLLALALAHRLPLVLFAEGGGGRPGDGDFVGVAGLDLPTFGRFARLSGQVPVLGIAAGNCFAGNAALLGCCDTIIATPDSSIGMGGPAMIEGGGLGVFRPEEVGPASVQSANGVIDILVKDEAEAVATARQYLAYRPAGGCGLGAGTAPRFCAGHDHRTCAHRRPADGPDRQQPIASGRRD
jgi:biotin carboxyl carrier protein/acetyl-CoA carboxylase beta subunit